MECWGWSSEDDQEFLMDRRRGYPLCDDRLTVRDGCLT